MPFFRDSSKKRRRRKFDDLFQKYQFDLDVINVWEFPNCELEEIPEELWDCLRLQNKKGLSLSQNKLKKFGTIPSHNNYTFSLLYIDLSHNSLRSISSEIAEFTLLRQLDLSFNDLNALPESLAKNVNLQILNIKENKFRAIPSVVFHLRQLRELNIEDNLIKTLPTDLARLHYLKMIKFSIHDVLFPPLTISQKGYPEVRKFLAKEGKTKYTEPPASLSTDFHASMLAKDDLDVFLVQQSGLNPNMEELQAELLRQDAQIESHLNNIEQERDELVSFLNNQEQMYKDDFNKLQILQDQEREKWLQILCKAENSAQSLIDEILVANKRNHDEETNLKELNFTREEALAKIQFEEIQNLKEDEIKRSMSLFLNDIIALEEKSKAHLSERDRVVHEALEQLNKDNSELKIEGTNQEILDQLIEEEEFQKCLFEKLLMQKDSERQRLLYQSQAIEAELMQLTIVDARRRRDEKDACIRESLDNERKKLCALLDSICAEKDNREKELRSILNEMKEQRTSDDEHYWLLQYKRLLDSKPLSLLNKEIALDTDIVKLLNRSGAEDYVSNFAGFKITRNVLFTLTNDDLIQIGVHNPTIRNSILDNIAEMDVKPKLVDVPSERPKPHILHRQISTTKIRVESECIICLDSIAQIVFFPCGHVCSCAKCYSHSDVSQCPLCMSPIAKSMSIELPTLAT